MGIPNHPHKRREDQISEQAPLHQHSLTVVLGTCLHINSHIPPLPFQLSRAWVLPPCRYLEMSTFLQRPKVSNTIQNKPRFLFYFKLGTAAYPCNSIVPSNGFPSGIPYSMGDQSSASWMTTDANGNPISKSSDHNGTWRSYPVDSSMSGQFSPYSHTSSTSTTWPAGGSDHEASESMGWSNVPQAVRSMSFSSEALGSQPQSPYFPLSQSRPYERQPSTYSDVYSSAISVAIEGSAGTVMDPTGSISPGAVPTPGHVAWQQQLLPQQHLYSRRDNFGGWGYGESGQSHQM